MTTTLNSHLSTLNSLIGQRGQISTERDKLQITVEIHDARSCYGRTEVLVSPENGSGQAWINIERVQL